MTRLFPTTLLLVTGFLLSPINGSGQTEGTYRFVLCEEECTTTDTVGVIAAGTLVLFPDSTFAAEIPSDVLQTVRRRSRWILMRDKEVNACFHIPHWVSRVGGHELFAGIIREGLTYWEVVEGEIRISLYQSPDGFFLVMGSLEDGRILGRGEQAHGEDPRPPDRAFLAERIGPPDPRRCTASSNVVGIG
jgi:hypothetical protein